MGRYGESPRPTAHAAVFETRSFRAGMGWSVAVDFTRNGMIEVIEEEQYVKGLSLSLMYCLFVPSVSFFLSFFLFSFFLSFSFWFLSFFLSFLSILLASFFHSFFIFFLSLFLSSSFFPF